MENTNPPMPPPPQQGNYQQQQYQQPPQGGYQQFNQGFPGVPVDLPGAGGTLTLGILGIVFSLGFLGLIFNIIALSKAGKQVAEYNLYPGRYTPGSLSKVKAGKVCAIIGLSITGLALLVIAVANA